jgi:hypothetical protein
MWTVVYIASNKNQAERLKNILSEEGILAQIRAVGLSNTGEGLHELLVPESEAEEAHSILCERAK